MKKWSHKRVYSNKKLLSAAQFLSLSEKQRAEILSTKPIPARLGSNSFGCIEVTYKMGHYVPARFL